MSQILCEEIVSPDGNTYHVSTIKTGAGGSPNQFGMFGRFSMQDFEDCAAWPFETMVFKSDSFIGLYHAAYATEDCARLGHTRIANTIAEGLEWGGGVDEYGGPATTPEQWFAKYPK